MVLRLTVDTPKAVRAALGIAGNRKDHFALFDDMAELARAPAHWLNETWGGSHWSGNVTAEEAARLCATGDLARVARSDALLQAFESYMPETSRKGWRDDVCGAIPNVPAYIAGHPLNMRRRVRLGSEYAPLAIIVDTASSSGVGAEAIESRGAAILALVRALAATRPVELWAITLGGADKSRNSVCIGVRIDTAPLDLARAAYALSHAGFPRALLYGIATALHGFNGEWPYDTNGQTRQFMAKILAPAFSHASETLCIPAVHSRDKCITEPLEWLKDQLATLAPSELAA